MVHRFIKGVGGRAARLRLELHTAPPSRASYDVHTFYKPLLSRFFPPLAFDSALVRPIDRLHRAEVLRWLQLPRCRYYRARRGEGLVGGFRQGRG